MRISALTLYTLDVVTTADFYRMLGIPLAPADGGRMVGEVDGGRIAIAPAGTGDVALAAAAGTDMIGFEVESVDEAVERAATNGAVVLRAPQAVSWGRRAILSDPDGRAVELVEHNL